MRDVTRAKHFRLHAARDAHVVVSLCSGEARLVLGRGRAWRLGHAGGLRVGCVGREQEVERLGDALVAVHPVADDRSVHQQNNTFTQYRVFQHEPPTEEVAALRVLRRLSVLVEVQREFLRISLRSSRQRQVDDSCNVVTSQPQLKFIFDE